MDSSLITILALVGFAGAVVLVMAVTRLRYSWMFIVGMLGCSALAGGYHPVFQPVRTWLAPVQEQRSSIFAGLGAILGLLMIVHVGKLKLHRLALQGWLMLAIGVYAGLIRLSTGDADLGLKSIAFAFATILPLVLLVPAVASEEGGYFRLLRGIGFVAAAWTLGVAIQFVVNRNALARGGFGSLRFQGLLGNPQHAAAFLGPTFVVVLCLFIHDPLKRMKLFWAGLLAAVGVMLLWTGSRSGAAMGVIGGSMVLYSRVGRSIILAPVAAGLIFAAFQLLSMLGVEILVDRLTSLQDTRSGAWLTLWQQFLDNPITGTGSTEETQFSENSYLLGMASYGIGMGLLIAALMIVSVAQCARLFFARAMFSPRGKALVDLTLAIQLLYFLGAMTEGYIVARVSTMQVFMLIFSSLASCLLSDAAEARHAAHHDEAEDEGDAGHDDAEHDDAGHEGHESRGHAA